MYEREILDKIRDSAENIEVPKNLSPDNLQKVLLCKNSKSQEDKNIFSKRKLWHINKIFAKTAVFVLIVAVTASIGLRIYSKTLNSGSDKANVDGNKINIFNTKDEKSDSEELTGTQKKQSVGDAYVIAQDYNNVYNTIEKYYSTYVRDSNSSGMESGIAFEEKSADLSEKAEYGSANRQEDVESLLEYSTTNVQTENIDESDIVKTDGRYIYKTTIDGVCITDIQTDDMKVVGNIKLDIYKKEGFKEIKEIYVDNNKLNLIVETDNSDILDDGIIAHEERGYLTEVKRISTKVSTSVITYDITDRENPLYEGEVEQDGSYYSSRKKGDIVYLFTNKYMELPDNDTHKIEDEIPKVGGQTIPAEDIYLADMGCNAFIITSVDIMECKKYVDTAMILNNADIYMGSEYLYLYNNGYNSDNTVITRFSMTDGVISGDTSGIVKGNITDTFSINEYNGKLRVVTWSWNEESSSDIFLLDDDLSVTGAIRGLARNEEIKSARFIGDKLYLVTYENTDPLFIIDLSDEANPEVLSSLEITGFSEYLHIWNDGMLLGFGIETDPHSGEWEGIKLCAFDVRDEADVKVSDTFYLKNKNYSSDALYDYKCILADRNANLFGFAVELGDRTTTVKYELFTLKDGKLHRLLDEEIDKSVLVSEVRGLYSGKHFYIVSEKGIKSFDMENNYSKVNEILFT